MNGTAPLVEAADAPPAGAPPADRAALDAALHVAHAARDTDRLVTLYEAAADGPASGATAADAAPFYLTHAYVFALEAGDPRAARLRARLVAMGREA
jgi:hypothetical protein